MKHKKTVGDFSLWEQFRHSIKPLSPKHKEALPSPQEKHAPKRLQNRPKIEKTLEISLSISPSSETFDFSIQKLLRIRKVCIEARLDLHGYTRQEAAVVLQRFINTAQDRGYEWILVITGKGDRQNPQTLRKLVPYWLNQMPQIVGYGSAKHRDGGEGAYYVKIRKKR